MVADRLIKTKKAVRRTTSERERGRAERVVASVLQATGEELGRVGYAAFKVEDVAARSGVNKTSIYRRWPTKADLVIAVLAQFRDRAVAIDTGSLRQDLRQSLVTIVEMSNDPKYRGILQVVVSRAEPEVEEITQAIRNQQHQMRVAMVERGIARGEIPPATDPSLVADLVAGPVIRRLLTFGDKIGGHYVDAVLDIVLAGLQGNSSRQAEPRP